MRVTRLEIFGFKSFVDRFVLNFDHNMIGIVGPNGCGKSNVVDALRWVLGETHAKQLRGSVLEDLIFNGSQSRRALGMAEVTLTVRPDAGWIPATLSVVEQLSQSGKTNGDVPHDGVSAESDDQTEPPSEPLEEPAILSSLLDIPGLFETAEIQLTRRLYRSGESEYFINRVPCRLRDMTEFYRLIGLGARGLSIVQQGQIGDIVGRKPLERRELLEEAAGISGFRTRIEAAQRKLEKTTDNIARIHDIVAEIEKNVRVLSRQAKRARDRGMLKEELRTHELDLFRARSAILIERRSHDTERAHRVLGAVDDWRGKISLLQAQEEESRSDLERFDVSISDLRQKRDHLTTTVTEKRNRVAEVRLELTKVEGRLKAQENGLERIGERDTSIRAEISEKRASLVEMKELEQGLFTKREDAEAGLRTMSLEMPELIDPEIVRLEQNADELKRELERLPGIALERGSLEATVQRLRQNVRNERDRLQEKKLHAASLESERRAIEAQLQALAESAVQATGAPATEGAQVLLASIQAPEDLQRALSAVLGEKATYLVVEDSHAFARAFANQPGERKQVGVIRKVTSTAPHVPGGFDVERLLDRISVDEAMVPTVEVFLGHVYLAHSLESALETIGRMPSGALVVTTAGEVVTSWGWYSPRGQGAAFAFRRVFEERGAELEELQGEVESLSENLDSLEQDLAREEETLRHRDAERERLQGLERRLTQILQDRHGRERMLEHRAREEVRKLQEEERRAQEQLRQIVSELASVSRSIILGEERVGELDGELRTLEIERRSLDDALDHSRIELERLNGDLASLSQVSESEAGHMEDAIRALDHELHGIETKRNTVKVRLGEVLHELDTLRRQVDSHQQEATEAQLAVDRASMELGMIHDDIRQHYGDDVHAPSPAEVAELKHAHDLEAQVLYLQGEVQSLRQRLEREGEVDPQSIDLFEQEKKRLDELRKQLTDLEQASTILNRTIRHLEEVSRERFLETFRDVRTKFSELIPRLFGGGAGHLELINPEDPLGSGVEIAVRPPGKKVRSMELLSGGEKALVATAILLSMFLHRPSPICVLDEVDAPLDDANLDRFLSLISEISSTTQFLVITHNKQTMAACERLLGITMQESGVSKALSVSFEQVSEEIDRLAANQ